jgi:DNA/RNA-binding domain of Phe-tRNA-synthetase-like protein
MRVLDVEIELAVPGIAVGIAIGKQCRTEPAPAALAGELAKAIAAAKANPPGREGAVRDMLRFGKYKPTGRGKPASEYLLRAAVEDRFPQINNLVDINNWISLVSLLPISLIDLGKSGSKLIVRRGRAGESYVFNSAGQVIELEDLLLVARMPEDQAIANPVKDSMMSKLSEGSADVIAVIYAPASLAEVARDAAEKFDRALVQFGGSRESAHGLLSSP